MDVSSLGVDLEGGIISADPSSVFLFLLLLPILNYLLNWIDADVDVDIDLDRSSDLDGD